MIVGQYVDRYSGRGVHKLHMIRGLYMQFHPLWNIHPSTKEADVMSENNSKGITLEIRPT